MNRRKAQAAAAAQGNNSQAAAASEGVDEEEKKEAGYEIDDSRVVDKAVARMISDTVKDSEFI